MKQITLDSIPVPNERALDVAATTPAADLEALLEQSELHIFRLDLGGMHHCLIASVGSFVPAVEPLLKLAKPVLRCFLAVAMQELAAEQVNCLKGTAYELDEPTVTLLDAHTFLRMVNEDGIGWTCGDERSNAEILAVLNSGRLHFVAPGHSEKRLLLNPQAQGVKELLRDIFYQLAQPDTVATEVVFNFDAHGELVSATNVDGATVALSADVESPVRFRAVSMLDVVNLQVPTDWGSDLCDETLATISALVDTDQLAQKLFDQYVGVMYEKLDEPIDIPVSRWVSVDNSVG